MRLSADFRAPGVGADLRAARERLGWSLEDTSAYVRIRLPFLRALEEGRLADLPAPVYALAFVRTYALALGVDADEIVRRYQDEVGGGLPKTDLAFPIPVPQQSVPKGAVALLGIAIAVVGYMSWYRVSADRGDSVQVQQVPARLAPLALPQVPLRPARVASAAPTVSVATAYQRPSVAPSAAEAAAPSQTGSFSALSPAFAASPTASSGLPSMGTGASASAGTVAGSRLVLDATQDAWVEVKDTQGRIVLSKLLHAGDSWPVPDQPSGAAPLVLTTGNAGGTQLLLDGKPLPALGAAGAVRHDIALDPTALAAHS